MKSTRQESMSAAYLKLGNWPIPLRRSGGSKYQFWDYVKHFGWARVNVTINNGTLYYFENGERHPTYEVRVTDEKHINQTATEFIPYSDITLLKIQGRTDYYKYNPNAQTFDKTGEEVEAFYNNIKQLLKYTKPYELSVIQGDFNAKAEILEGIARLVG